MKKRNKRTAALIAAVWIGIILAGTPFLQVKAYTNTENKEEAGIKTLKENSLYAKSAILMDAESGRVLYGKNATEKMPMASTTKIMTLLIALEQGDMNQVVTVSEYAAGMPDVQLNMKQGEQYVLEDLLYSLMLESHNDSAVAIAEGVAGSIEEFANRMNQKAKEIGCENTCFITPNGLDATAVKTKADGTKETVFHSTTAADLAKIMSYCITQSPRKEDFLKITGTPAYSFSNCEGTRNFTCRNHNSFLYMMDGALSGKTGFTAKAGYCYVGALKRDQKTLVVALLACGWPNNKTYKWKDTKKLMEYGLENYEYKDFADVWEEIKKEGRVPVYNGQTGCIGETAYAKWKTEPFNQEDEIGILLQEGEEILVTREMEKEMTAPVYEGEEIGKITFSVDEEIYLEKKICITETIEEIDYEWCLRIITDKFFGFNNCYSNI